MGCCGGNCSCGKENKTPVEDNLRMVQLPISQGMLPTFDWMKGMKDLTVDEEVVEVRFKNNRKDFYRNRFGLTLSRDDRVVVEVEGGHDVGTVSLIGTTAEKQFYQKSKSRDKVRLNKIYRKTTQVDTENWLNAKRRERDVLLEARKVANSLGLEMSIGDVELQGDGRKVTVYYTADGRVDFRELIRRYAASFRLKVEMRQRIGKGKGWIYQELLQ